MRPLFQAVSAQVRNMQMLAINVYDTCGAHADQMIRPLVNDEIAAESVRELMESHRFETVDLETDDEALFMAFIQEAGVNVSYVDTDNLTALYRQLQPDSPIYSILAELYQIENETQEEVKTEPELPALLLPWYRRFFNYIRGLFR